VAFGLVWLGWLTEMEYVLESAGIPFNKTGAIAQDHVGGCSVQPLGGVGGVGVAVAES
jgi:hypothetical protein